MNIYEKLNELRDVIIEAGIKKTGKNKHAGFEYYELGDFMPHVIKYSKARQMIGIVDFSDEKPKLLIINTEKPEERIVFSSDKAEANIPGTQEIQKMGGAQTYQRRYLWIQALELTENDSVDSSEPVKKSETKTPPPPSKKSELKPATEEETIMLCKFGTIEAINNALLDYTKKGIVFNPEQKARITDRRAELELMKK
jgi:hypothetical protein